MVSKEEQILTQLETQTEILSSIYDEIKKFKELYQYYESKK
jgi:hypothetical protein